MTPALDAAETAIVALGLAFAALLFFIALDLWRHRR